MEESQLMTEIRRLRDEVDELKAKAYAPEFKMGLMDTGWRGFGWNDDGFIPFEASSGGMMRPVTASHWYEPTTPTDAVTSHSGSYEVLWQTEFVSAGPDISVGMQSYGSADAGSSRLKLHCPQTNWTSNVLMVPGDGAWRTIRLDTRFYGISTVSPVTMQVLGHVGANAGVASLAVTRPTPLINGGYLDTGLGLVIS